jgi:hypothetical protein
MTKTYCKRHDIFSEGECTYCLGMREERAKAGDEVFKQPPLLGMVKREYHEGALARLAGGEYDGAIKYPPRLSPEQSADFAAKYPGIAGWLPEVTETSSLGVDGRVAECAQGNPCAGIDEANWVNCACGWSWRPANKSAMFRCGNEACLRAYRQDARGIWIRVFESAVDSFKRLFEDVDCYANEDEKPVPVEGEL